MALAQIDNNNRVYSLDDRYWSYFFIMPRDIIQAPAPSLGSAGTRCSSWTLSPASRTRAIRWRWRRRAVRWPSRWSRSRTPVSSPAKSPPSPPSKKHSTSRSKVSLVSVLYSTQVKQAGPYLCQPPIERFRIVKIKTLGVRGRHWATGWHWVTGWFILGHLWPSWIHPESFRSHHIFLFLQFFSSSKCWDSEQAEVWGAPRGGGKQTKTSLQGEI